MWIHKLLLTGFLLFFSQATVDAASLHAIIVCDTDAIGIEKSVEADYKNIQKEIKRICKFTELTPKIFSFKGKNVNAAFVNTIHSLSVNPDDVILFYWSGHGKRFYTQTNPWPIFDFEYDSTVIYHYDVTLELVSKKPRLLLSIADCCNDYVDFAQGFEPRLNKGLSEQSYRKLFLFSKGAYILSGSLPGEISFALNRSSAYLGLPAGGFLTNAFLEILHNEAANNNTEMNWDFIFQGTIDKAIDYQLSDIDDPTVYQHPQYASINSIID